MICPIMNCRSSTLNTCYFFRDWLAENNYNESGAVTSVEAAWGLLKKIVDQYEIKGQTNLKKAVAVRLISLGR